MTMQPQNFGASWNQIGILYLVFIPFALLAIDKRKYLFFCMLAFFYFLIWFYLVQNLRFLFSLLPILALIIGVTIQSRIALVALLLLNFANAIHHTLPAIPPPLTDHTRTSYLLKHEPVFAVSMAINRFAKAGKKIFVSEMPYIYYLDAEPVRGTEFINQNHFDRLSPIERTRSIRSAGISYIFATQSLLLDTASLKLLKEMTFEGRKYRLFEV
jgi:hypothetical protein